jgi:tRNA pseudouridine38-40 synthase
MAELAPSPSLQRYRLDLEYDGTDFAGWQVQPGERTVQGTVEAILTTLFPASVRVTGAGRTDRGCHAAGQVAHFDAPPRYSASEIARALKALLPEDVRLKALFAVAPEFHARYAAIERAYVYAIGRRRSVLDRRRRWELGRRLSLGAMRAASAPLRGEHDFRAYAVGDDGPGERSGRCRVVHADWDLARGGYRFTIVADRFLTRMVRLLVGALVEVGVGTRAPESVAQALGGAPLHPRPAAAPASGLCLAWVRYAGEPEVPRAPGKGLSGAKRGLSR